METKIVMIPTEKLEHHPQNPRKNIGDITELTASIKASGVLQNLTVVPNLDSKDKYYVVIGNRRLEAGTAAGLTEFPCIISTMDHHEQLETMLVENINRSDLTPIEEAEGFKQLTLAGFSVKEIHEKTGFSEATINRRLKIAEYNQKKAAEALERGATLADFAKLEKLKDEKDREALLEDIGTNNFNQHFNRLLADQAERENKPLFKALLKGKAKYISEKELGDTWSPRCKYEQDRKNNPDISLRKPYTKDNIEVNGDYEHFYCFRYGDCEFYRLKPVKEKATKDKPAHTEQQKCWERNRRQLNKLSEEAFQLRREFMEEFQKKKSFKDWQNICIKYAIKLGRCFGVMNIVSDYHFRAERHLEDYRESTQKATERFEAYFDEHAAGTLAYLIYEAVNDRADRVYHENNQYEHPKGTDNYPLSLIYEFLEALGYEMSDEEKMWQKGNHPLQQKTYTNIAKTYNR